MSRLLALIAFPLLLATLIAQEAPHPYNPKVAPASPEPGIAQKRIRVPQGMQLDLWAAEPLLANPICFCIDEKGRIYVAETFRLHAGVTDNRGHPTWLDDDLACRTVEDRLALYKKHLGKNFPSYEKHHDRVRLLEDTKGTGKADKDTVFADGFNDAVSGLGSGLLARRGNVYFTNIPDLWLLKDTKGAGVADQRTKLSSGYGVHIAFIGHDLHGLRMGPDGKLYFSIGDRGFHVKTPDGRVLDNPDSGAVLRCNSDGSDLEVVATGLRNPQELAFDAYGNLWTGDNNADGGDQARLVYVVEGGDSGWRIGYQYMSIPGGLGPWNAEKMWHTPWDGQAAYLVPPIAHLSSGPSGFCAYPGLGLADRYKDHFFLADFRGGSGGSGVRSFGVKPKGAAFEMVDHHEFIGNVLATDVDFGYDGAMYVSDWVEGWGLTGKGRIWRVHDTEKAKDPVVQSVKKLMAEGFTQRPQEELLKLLEHPDMRVRQEAQFALVEKGKDVAKPLLKFAHLENQSLFARLHATWALGQLGMVDLLDVLLEDTHPEIRTQAAKTIGRSRGKINDETIRRRLRALLKDSEPRVRFHAALALGKVGEVADAPQIVEMLRAAGDKDPYLRHAGVMALTYLKPHDALLAATKDDSPAVRMAALLTLRRLQSPEVARFLNDSEPKLVLEAARAINDVPINDGLPALAKLSDRVGLADPLLYRVINANLRVGKPENAAALATLAARRDVPEALRLEAVRALSDWAKPSSRDRIVGLWRPLEPRSADVAATALRPALGAILSGPDKLRAEAVKLVVKLGIKDVGPTLFAMIGDTQLPGAVRAETVLALDALNDPRAGEAMKLALADKEPAVRVAGLRLQTRITPADAYKGLAAALEQPNLVEPQGALAILGGLKGLESDKVLNAAFDQLLAGKLRPELHLDLLEAAAKHPTLKDSLAKFDAARSKTDHLAKYRESLVGGDAEAGRRLFQFKTEFSCVRCHKVKGEGGDVGPELAGLAAKQPREYLLEALVDPNKQIAKGFETVVLLLKNGKIETGVLKSEDNKEVKLITAEGKLVTVAKDQIDERTPGKSAMPEDLIGKMTKRELRDLVEYLAGLK